MSLLRVAQPLLRFSFVLCALMSCYSVASEDLERPNARFVVAGLATVRDNRGESEDAVRFEDRDALLAFKEGVVDDPSGALSGWDDQTLYCSWHGVRCQADRVIGLKLRSSLLGGSISSRITQLSELRHLDLSNNSLSGFIPSELWRLKHLQALSLSMNKLSSFFDGMFVQSHGKKLESRSEMEIFNISSCGSQFPELRVLDLSNNFLTGAISQKLGCYSKLRELKLGNNLLIGTIPASLGSLRFLSIVSLENNMLDSSIPAQLGNCRRLEYLDVRNNFLSGKVPSKVLQLLDLRYLDLTNNHLEDYEETTDRKSTLSVSKSVLTPLQNLIFRLPNFFIFGYARATGRSRRWLITQSLSPSFAPAPAPAPLQDYAPASPRVTARPPWPAPRKNPHTARRWALGLIIGFIAGAVSGLIVCMVFNKIRAYWNKASPPAGPMIFNPHIQPKDLEFLENEETFTGQSALLGKGASGQVFKACLANGMLVAIKKIPIRTGQATPAQHGPDDTSPDIAQVRAELETVGKIRHRNLVLMLAYMSKPDSHLLIYQYMKNGSLHDILGKVREGSMELKWVDRYRIASSIAVGMKYLHFDCRPRVLHRDIKPSNILLDEDMEAHLGDFGLARLIPDDKSHITTGWAGTVGYIPPEYQQTCRFTEAGDVYSYGVTLAVLLTGREPTEEISIDGYGGSIVAWVQHNLQAGRINHILDPKMGVLGEELVSVELVAKVAMFCTSHHASDRPSSKDVVAMLEQIRGKREISALDLPAASTTREE